MKARLLLMIGFACVALLGGCNRESGVRANEALTGTFGVASKNGEIEPFMKIEADPAEPSGYAIFERSRDGWRRPKSFIDGGNLPVRAFGKGDLEKEFKHPVTGEIVGLSAGGVAFVHAPAGWKSEDGSHPFTTKSGYFAMTVLGPVELVRVRARTN